MRKRYVMSAALLMLTAGFWAPAQAQSASKKFEVVEATIMDIQNAIKAGELTATELVNMYLARIKAYNGTCVEQPFTSSVAVSRFALIAF